MQRRSDLSTAEMAEYTGRSIQTLSRWARGGHEAAKWSEFEAEWRWLPAVFDRVIANSRSRPQRVRPGPKTRLKTVRGEI